MPKPFLGVGWNFPVDVDTTTNKLKLAAFEESVRQAIWNILGTAKGERVMRPEFGCGIHDLVFATNTAATSSRIAAEVQKALLLFEPRIEVLNIEVQPGGSGEVLLIRLAYRIRSTNNVFNLVYPFYLEHSAG